MSRNRAHSPKEPRRSRPDKGMVAVTLRVPADKVEALKRYANRISKQIEPAQRDFILDTLRRHKATLDRYGVEHLSLFGSVVRDEAKPYSDVDLLVKFAPGQPAGLFGFVELKNVLEGILGRPVDLVTADHLKPRLKARILAECVCVY